MLEAKKASFSFVSFKVPRFSFDDNNHKGEQLKLGFMPKGHFVSKSGEFELSIKFVASENMESDKPVLELNAIAVFKFDSSIPFSEIPEFFYNNSIAIMFPYIRAFVSTLTLQANTKLLKLGLMNLTGLEEQLKSNTSFE